MRESAKSESEEKMKMVWGRVLLLAATVAGLEVAIEDYFGDVTFLQGKHSMKNVIVIPLMSLPAKLGLIPTVMISGKKQTVVCTVEDPDPVGAIRWRIGDRLTLNKHLNIVQVKKNYSLSNMFQYSFSQLLNPNLACSRQQP